MVMLMMVLMSMLMLMRLTVVQAGRHLRCLLAMRPGWSAPSVPARHASGSCSTVPELAEWAFPSLTSCLPLSDVPALRILSTGVSAGDLWRWRWTLRPWCRLAAEQIALYDSAAIVRLVAPECREVRGGTEVPGVVAPGIARTEVGPGLGGSESLQLRLGTGCSEGIGGFACNRGRALVVVV